MPLFPRPKSAFQLIDRVHTTSLGSAQLEIGTLENGYGQRSKGIVLIFPSQTPSGGGPTGNYIFPFQNNESIHFVDFLDEVLVSDLPTEFDFANDTSGRWFAESSIRWKVTKYVENWHGGGGFRGWMGNCYGYTVTKSDTQQLRSVAETFFSNAA